LARVLTDRRHRPAGKEGITIMRFKKNSEITDAELWDMQDKMAECAGQAITHSKKVQGWTNSSEGERRQAAKQAEQAMGALNAVEAEIRRRQR
jgi:hypothetical protein